MLNEFLDTHAACSLDDVRRGTRLGMGPCQGGFCTFRAAGLVAERAAGKPGGTDAALADDADQAIVGYLRERFKGTLPIAAGRQLQELWMVMGMYMGALGLESLIEREPAEQPREVVDAQR